MRALPAGIELRQARGGDIERVEGLVQSELRRYSEWAPNWRLAPPPPGMMERLTALYDDDERAWVLMALHGDQTVGVASLSLTTAVVPDPPPPGTAYVWQMFARRDWQGTGLAGALLDRLFEQATRRGYSRLVLWTAAGAKQARRFYEKEGFTLSGRDQPDSAIGLSLVEYERAVEPTSTVTAAGISSAFGLQARSSSAPQTPPIA